MARQTSINWTGSLFLILSPIAALILGVYHIRTEGFLWEIWALAAVFYALTAVSITGGYHRCFSHKTYEAKTALKWFWALFGAAAFQNSILIWARDHRVHHRFVDTDTDPYSINRGFFFAHLGWMLVNETPRVKLEPYGRDLERDPVVAFQDKHYVIIAVLMGFALPTLLGWAMGSWMGGLAIAGFVRIVALHHMTFFINSACHCIGKQRYTDTNTARDSFLMAIATFGEGYHNFHHFFANDYRNGIRWYHWDPTKWAIRALSSVGLAHSLRRTPWSEIVRAQMLMDEKRVRMHLNEDWSQQIQEKLDGLKARVEAAHVQFEKLKEEYRQIAKNYAHSSMTRLQEMKLQMRLARIEFRAALKQWRLYNAFLLELAPA